ncbi:MAG: hypothetical protein JWN04_5934 [Myxococcaceae bacterium]|nr:hypothetical protein [Myxococcaceae bacterium]
MVRYILMSKEETQTPEMDSLVDHILRGERALLFAPGIWSFVGASGATGFGITFLVTAVVPALLGDYSVPTRATSGIGGVLLGAMLASVCSSLVIHGFEAGRKVWQRVTPLCFAASVLALAVMLTSGDKMQRVASCIAVVMLGVATLLLRSSGFGLFVLFRQRLKARRKALLAEM